MYQLKLFIAIAILNYPCSNKLESTLEKFSHPNPFKATVECDHKYRLGEEVDCQFSIKNQDDIGYYLLQRHTPLEGLRSGYLSVTGDGKPIEYDGIMIMRADPKEEDYVLVKAGSTISAKLDLSLAYAINKTGEYSVRLRTKAVFHPKMRGGNRRQIIGATTCSLTTETTRFQLNGSGAPKKTVGEHHRQESISKQNVGIQQSGSPLDPTYIGGSEDDRSSSTQIHIASYHYASAADDIIDDDQGHYINWFGRADARIVRDTSRV